VARRRDSKKRGQCPRIPRNFNPAGAGTMKRKEEGKSSKSTKEKPFQKGECVQATRKGGGEEKKWALHFKESAAKGKPTSRNWLIPSGQQNQKKSREGKGKTR